MQAKQLSFHRTKTNSKKLRNASFTMHRRQAGIPVDKITSSVIVSHSPVKEKKKNLKSFLEGTFQGHEF